MKGLAEFFGMLLAFGFTLVGVLFSILTTVGMAYIGYKVLVRLFF
jgi:hypothetical protein